MAAQSVSLLRRSARGVGRARARKVDLPFALCDSVRRVHSCYLLPPLLLAASFATRNILEDLGTSGLGHAAKRQTSYRCAGPLILAPFPPVTALVLPNSLSLGCKKSMYSPITRLLVWTTRSEKQNDLLRAFLFFFLSFSHSGAAGWMGGGLAPNRRIYADKQVIDGSYGPLEEPGGGGTGPEATVF